MRMDAKTLGTGFGSLILGLLIGVFGLARFVCDTDGNPVGFHLAGYVKLEQAANLSSCSNAQKACYLQIDVTFDPAVAPNATPTACPTPPFSCYEFSNIPAGTGLPPLMQPTKVAIDYGHPGDQTKPPYTDYLYGVIQGSLTEPPPPSRQQHPSTPH